MYSTQLLIADRSLREMAIRKVPHEIRPSTCRTSRVRRLLLFSRLTICQIGEVRIAPFNVNTSPRMFLIRVAVADRELRPRRSAFLDAGAGAGAGARNQESGTRPCSL